MVSSAQSDQIIHNAADLVAALREYLLPDASPKLLAMRRVEVEDTLNDLQPQLDAVGALNRWRDDDGNLLVSWQF
jgi:hypothetical protein